MSEATQKAKRRPQRAPRVSIRVKQVHIDTAVPKHSSHCMIADAIKEAVPNAGKVSVDLQTIRWSDYGKGLRYTFLTPRPASVALVQFDQGVKPKPFSFRLRGALVTTLKTKGDGKRKSIHKFGPRHLSISNADQGNGLIPDVIGGRPPPKFGTRREFGMRGLSLNEVFKS